MYNSSSNDTTNIIIGKEQDIYDKGISKYDIYINSLGLRHAILDKNLKSIGYINIGITQYNGSITDGYTYDIGIKTQDNSSNHCFTTDGRTFDLSTKLDKSSIEAIDPFDVQMLFI